LPSAVVEELIEALTHLHETAPGREALAAVLRAERLVYGEPALYDALSQAVAVVRAAEVQH